MEVVAWISGSRPKTWIASISPVVIGSAIAAEKHLFSWKLFALCLLFALCIQIGTNYSNDYFDFMRGADTASRKGPKRLIQQGVASPKHVLAIALGFFAAAWTVSAIVSTYVGWPAIAISATALTFGFLYTATRYSLAYLGLGEIFVLLFFGLAATAGSEYIQTTRFSMEGVVAAFGPGLFSTALIVINNLRDKEEDEQANKKTLAVRFGSLFAKCEYVFCILGACGVPLLLAAFSGHLYASLAALVCIPAIPLMKKVLTFTSPQALNGILAKTGMLFFLYTALFTLGWLWK